MTRPRHTWSPTVVVLMIVALLVLVFLGWRALTIESNLTAAGRTPTEELGCRQYDGSGRHGRGPVAERLITTSEAAETPGIAGEVGARRSHWRRWRP